MSKYLVTGGCGFIGSHLVDALVHAGHHVVVIDNLSTGKLEHLNPGVKFINGEVTDTLLINKILRGMDGCFHLAALTSIEYSNHHWLQSNYVNSTGTITVFDCAKSANAGKAIPVIYASSSAVYGNNTDTPLTEQASLQPLSVYAADKISTESHAQVAYKVHHVPSIGLRLFDVYGPRQDPKSHYARVILTFFQQIMSDKAIKVHGDGQQVRDFIYVSDVVNYFLQAMYSVEPGCEIYNICSGKETSVNTLISTLKNIMHKDNVEINHIEQKSSSPKICIGDPSLAFSRFNIKPQVNLSQGLGEMILNFHKMHETTLQSQFYNKEKG